MIEWLMQNQTLVTWGLAFLAALTALAAGWVQGHYALRSVRDQLSHADKRSTEQENQERAALMECLRADLIILAKRLDSTRMALEDSVRTRASSALVPADLVLSVPDTITTSWRDLAKCPPELVSRIRKLSVEMTDVRELIGDPYAARDTKVFAQAALMGVRRASTTLSELNQQVEVTLGSRKALPEEKVGVRSLPPVTNSKP